MDVSRLCPHCMREQKHNGEFCSYCGKNIKQIEAGLHQLNPFTILQGKYLVGDVLGEGGFGITYIGIDMNIEVRLAIKEFYPNGYVSRDHTQTTIVTQYNNSNAAAVRKWKEGFVKEARALGKCQNLPGIVGVRDFFEENGTAYIVMEYVDGTTLKSYVAKKGGKMSPDEFLPVIRPVMTSLQQVHDAGVIHRDISPDNIMFTNDGRMKLLDFGAARSYAEADAQKSLSVMLKPGYAPEEQYRTHGEQGPWSDVYALAATIYRCITGVVPVESMERMRNDTLKSPKQLGINVSDQVDKAIMKAMAVYAENRFQSIKEFEDALYNGAPIMDAGSASVVSANSAPVNSANTGNHQQSGGSGQVKKDSKIPLYVGIGAAAAILLGFIVVKAISGGSGQAISSPAAVVEDAVERTQPEKEDTTVQEETAAATEEILPWKESYYSEIRKITSSGGVFSLEDINKDNIPEMIVIGDGEVTLFTSDSKGVTDKMKYPCEIVGVDSSNERICLSYLEDNVIYDVALSTVYGKWTVEQHGETEVYIDEYDNSYFEFYYQLDGREVQQSNYYSWLEGIYRNARSIVDMPLVRCSSAENVLGNSGDHNQLAKYSDANYAGGYDYDYACSYSPKLCFISKEGDYVFELKGGAGGSDGERALGNQPYDGNGATMKGTMHLNLGDRLVITVGGAGGVTRAQEGVVAGGYNGGGDAYWSGGGGGCTDVYYNGKRVVAAAGGGGGNYDQWGGPGRISRDNSNTTGSKYGFGTGYTGADDSGAGGGGGWLGDMYGKKDGAGYAGVNGYDSNYFYLISESEGEKVATKGTEDGYAHIYLK